MFQKSDDRHEPLPFVMPRVLDCWTEAVDGENDVIRAQIGIVSKQLAISRLIFIYIQFKFYNNFFK